MLEVLSGVFIDPAQESPAAHAARHAVEVAGRIGINEVGAWVTHGGQLRRGTQSGVSAKSDRLCRKAGNGGCPHETAPPANARPDRSGIAQPPRHPAHADAVDHGNPRNAEPSPHRHRWIAGPSLCATSVPEPLPTTASVAPASVAPASVAPASVLDRRIRPMG